MPSSSPDFRIGITRVELAAGRRGAPGRALAPATRRQVEPRFRGLCVTRRCTTRNAATPTRPASRCGCFRPGSSSTKRRRRARPRLRWTSGQRTRSAGESSSSRTSPSRARQAVLQGQREEGGREPDPFRRRLRQRASSGHRLAVPRPSQKDRSCRKPLFWVERGVSSDPSDISVRCTCGASVSWRISTSPSSWAGASATVPG